MERMVIKTSSYSGKCDFRDTCEIHGIDNVLKSKIYLGWNILPLEIKSEKDLVPYYPYLVVASASENGIGSFHLSMESFVDREEREFLEWYQNQVVRYINRCKRHKEEINPDHFKGEFSEKILTEILRRVIDKNMSLDGIYRPMAEYYREKLFEEMIRVGWSKSEALRWVYGFRKDKMDELAKAVKEENDEA